LSPYTTLFRSRSMLPPMPNIASTQTHNAQPASPAYSQVRAPTSAARIGCHRRGRGLQVAVQVEARVDAAAAALVAAELVALGEDVEVVDEQPRRTAFQRVQ